MYLRLAFLAILSASLVSCSNYAISRMHTAEDSLRIAEINERGATSIASVRFLRPSGTLDAPGLGIIGDSIHWITHRDGPAMSLSAPLSDISRISFTDRALGFGLGFVGGMGAGLTTAYILNAWSKPKYGGYFAGILGLGVWVISTFTGLLMGVQRNYSFTP